MKTKYYNFFIKEFFRSLTIYKSTLDKKEISAFFQGVYIKEPLQIEFYAEGSNPPDVLVSMSVLLISNRLKNLFEQLMIEGVQFIPAQVIHKSGIGVPGYYILNILTVLPAWDKENTVWVNKDEKGMKQNPELNVWQIALKKEVIGKKHIFCLEKPKFEVYISEYLKKEIEKHKFDVGVGFYPVYAY